MISNIIEPLMIIVTLSKMVEFAGLEDQVTVVEGAFADNLHVLQGKVVDVCL